MTDGTLTLVVLVIVADLVLAVIVTRAINRRGYTGLRKAILMALTWLVPGIGAFCAAVTMWSRGRGEATSEPTSGTEYVISPADAIGSGHGHDSP